MKTKAISIFLIFALIFTLIPATAFAGARVQGDYNGVSYTISDDSVLTVSPGEATEEYTSGEMGGLPDFSSYTA